jgi:hypothetical protein
VTYRNLAEELVEVPMHLLAPAVELALVLPIFAF